MRSPSKPEKAVDPVREIIKQVRPIGIALSRLLNELSRGAKAAEQGTFNLKVSRRKVSGLIFEFSTSSPRRRQTIKLLLIGKHAYLQVPTSVKLATQLKKLVRAK